MDILAPDEANFDHLKQVDTNIQPYIKNMSRVLTNSIEILISDSFNKAIEIHSHLPHLQFPISKWIRYYHISEQQFLKILKNTTPENFPALIDNLVHVDKIKDTQHINPFIFSYCFTEDAQSIINNKYDLLKFQKQLVEKLIEELPSYKSTVSTFAFAEIVKISLHLHQESQHLFSVISEQQADDLFSKALKNDYTYSLVDSQQEFFKTLQIPIENYLKSSQKNSLVDFFIQKVSSIEPFNNTIFPTLYPNEVQLVQKLKNKHDCLVLENKLPEKNSKTKQPKI